VRHRGRPAQPRRPAEHTEPEGKEKRSPLETLIVPLNNVLESLANSAASDPILAALLIVVIVPSLVVVIAAAVLTEMPPLSFIVATYLAAAPIALILAYVFAQTQRSNPRVRTTSNTVRLAENLPLIDRKGIEQILSRDVDATATAFGLRREKVRASLFGIDGRRRLRMVSGLCVGDYTEDEPTIRLRLGEGVVGHCFASGSPLMVELSEAKQYWLEESEQRKLHPDLAWVIAVPVSHDGRSIWVISVSGLQRLGRNNEFAHVLATLSEQSRALSDKFAVAEDAQR
jgi:hypothetical protein